MWIGDKLNPVVLEDCFVTEFGVWILAERTRGNYAVSKQIIGLANRENLENGGRGSRIETPQYTTAAQKRLPGIVQTREADGGVGHRM